MTVTSARLLIPTPQAADPNDIPANLLAMADALETRGAGMLTGTFAARPVAAAANARFLYLVTGGGANSGRVYVSDGAAWVDILAVLAVPTTVTFAIERTWAIGGTIAVPSGDTDFLIPTTLSEITNEVTVLDRVRYSINSGTSVTFKLQVGGVDAAGFTGLSATTTPTLTNPADVAIADLDRLAPVVTAVAGTPKNLSVTAMLKKTVTLT